MGFFSSCNPKDKTTVSAWMLISTLKVDLNPTSAATLANSAGLSMKPPAFTVPRFALGCPELGCVSYGAT
jgi:hypothetical protein